MSKRIIRVFPRKTNATPDDELAIVNREPEVCDYADEVHISVSWTWDLPRAEVLAMHWKHVAPVTIGGPATGMRGEAFTPGMYVRHGYTITSRGCPNKCWFCSVWKREGNAVRELPIHDGWNVLDDNLLACSDVHVMAVFAMLNRVKKQTRVRPQFTGGLEAARLKPWHVDALRELRPKQMFFAYDTPDDYEPLVVAGRMLLDSGFTTKSHQLRCYVLCGWPSDTFGDAERRMEEAKSAGFTPMAMVWMNDKGDKDAVWAKWARQWIRPGIIYSKGKK